MPIRGFDQNRGGLVLSTAEYLIDPPRCTQPEVVAFIAGELKITIELQTLRRVIEAYGLDVFRPDQR